MIDDWLDLIAVAAAFALSLGLTRWLCSHTPSGLTDHPNARSLHQKSVPRSGGIAVIIGATLPLLVLWWFGWSASTWAGLAMAMVLVASVSLWDDFGHVSWWLRFLIHGVASWVLMAGGLVWASLDLPGLAWSFPMPLAWILTFLFVVWMINLFNFMDGMDGFAGGMALFGFGALAMLGWRGGEPLFGLTAACIAAAGVGFLTHNFPPARIFLGDIGSSSLGLAAAGLSLWGVKLGLFPLWVPLLAFSPFIVDATWTFFGRLFKGERVWEAHRSHHYQRLALAGWGHRKTVLRSYLVMGGAAACAIASPSLSSQDQWIMLAAWAGIYVLIHFRVGLAERQPSHEQS